MYGSEGIVYSCMGKGSSCLYMCLVNTNEAMKLQKAVAVHPFLPPLLFPHSTSLTWRMNAHRHCPSRMVSGFVTKAQNSGITDPVLFSTLGSLSPVGKSLHLCTSVHHFPAQEVLKDIYNLFPRSLCNENFVVQLKSHGARLQLLHALADWP